MAGPSESVFRPNFRREGRLSRLHSGPVAGVDEAGRGPWAGPVVAAAVILDQGRIPKGIDDSKRLAAEKRERLYDEIMANARVGIAIGEVERIDRDNIFWATMWAMQTALADLDQAPAFALIDGNRCPELPCPSEAIVAGDQRSLSIAAASIIAKVTRDRIMQALAREFDGYGWHTNKGYGTPEHAEAIWQRGVTVHHRRSWRPVRQALQGVFVFDEGVDDDFASPDEVA